MNRALMIFCKVSLFSIPKYVKAVWVSEVLKYFSSEDQINPESQRQLWLCWDIIASSFCIKITFLLSSQDED